MRTVLRLLGAAVLVVVLAGCRVDATIDIEVAADGTGTVSVEAVFDPAAVEALDGLGEGVFLSDLGSSGWTVTRPQPEVDGSLTISATKPVTSAAEIQIALDEIAGPGVFTDVRITASDSFAERNQALAFDIDLGAGWELFSDAGVAEALGGEPFGVPIEQLTGGRSLDEVLGVSVTATLTGDDEQAPVGGQYTPRFDDSVATEVRLETTVENSTAVLLRWIAIALAFLTVLSILLALTGIWLQRRAERLRPPTTPSTLSSRIPGRVTVPATATAPTDTRAEDTVRLVVVEPLAVLYRHSEPSENELLAFVRQNQGDAPADELLDAYDDLLRGRMDTAQLWEIAGIAGPSGEVDDRFVSMRWLRREAAPLLRELERRRIPVAAVTNDAASWSATVRTRDRLTAVWPWLVSGELGAAKPDPGMFERLRRETGTAYGHCLYIDSDVDHLDAARDLGMRTALYDADGLDLPDLVGHPVVTDLLQLVRRST